MAASRWGVGPVALEREDGEWIPACYGCPRMSSAHVHTELLERGRYRALGDVHLHGAAIQLHLGERLVW
jgi:hypothetical protein